MTPALAIAAPEDPGMPSMEERAVQVARVSAMLDAWPKRRVDLEAARQSADEAVRGLIPGLLTDSELIVIRKGHKAFARQER